jgi:hypothetical protein
MNFTANQELKINDLVNKIIMEDDRITHVFREESKYKNTKDEDLIITFIKGDSVHLSDEYDLYLEDLWNFYSERRQIVCQLMIHHLDNENLLVREYMSLDGQMNGNHLVSKYKIDKKGINNYC